MDCDEDADCCALLLGELEALEDAPCEPDVDWVWLAALAEAEVLELPGMVIEGFADMRLAKMLERNALPVRDGAGFPPWLWLDIGAVDDEGAPLLA